jgi:hypothetical protein
MKRALAVLSCCTVLACTQQNPIVVAQSPQNVILRRIHTIPLQTNFDFAATHCRQYSREARFLGTQPLSAIVMDDQFLCVAASTTPPPP